MFFQTSSVSPHSGRYGEAAEVTNRFCSSRLKQVLGTSIVDDEAERLTNSTHLKSRNIVNYLIEVFQVCCTSTCLFKFGKLSILPPP